MRPLLLKGHERSITTIKYNKDGDLIFTCSKDNKPSVWWSKTGMRIGTYNGHNGAVWHMDVTDDSTLLITGSADGSAKIWNVRTGEELCNLTQQGPVRAVGWAEGGARFFIISNPLHGRSTGATPLLQIYDTPEELLVRSAQFEGLRPVGEFQPTVSIKIPTSICAVWMPENRAVMIGCDDGKLQLYHPVKGDMVFEVDAHTERIHDIQFNKDKTLFITSSKDCSALLFDTHTIKCLKKFLSQVPVNSASIHPNFDHIMMGGGQEAMNVTTSDARSGKFEVRFMDLIFEELFGTVKGHFGPVNSLAFHPSGHGFASGAEDGYVRVHTFDANYMRKQELDTRELEKSVAFADQMESKVQAQKAALLNAGIVQ